MPAASATLPLPKHTRAAAVILRAALQTLLQSLCLQGSRDCIMPCHSHGKLNLDSPACLQHAGT